MTALGIGGSLDMHIPIFEFVDLQLQYLSRS